VAGGKGKLRNELSNLYTFPSVVRMKMKWVGHVACLGEKWNACRILLRKPKGKRSLGRRRRWVDNVVMDLRQNGVVWTG
jgi:hypothetical protein